MPNKPLRDRIKYTVNTKKVLEKHNKEEKEAIKAREKAMQIAKQIIEKIKEEKGEITKEEILNHLAEDVRNNELYKTWICILCNNGSIPEIRKESCR